MLTRRAKLVHSAVAAALVWCLLSPFVEFLLHENNSIFLSGRDTESTLALVLLLVELSFAVAKLLGFAARTVFRTLAVISSSNWMPTVRLVFPRVFPAASPPGSLRI